MNSVLKELQIKEYIYSKIIESGVSRDEINDDSELVDERLISSILLIQIITGIEEHLDTIILNDDVGIEEFATINKMMNIVSKYLT